MPLHSFCLVPICQMKYSAPYEWKLKTIMTTIPVLLSYMRLQNVAIAPGSANLT